MQTEILEYIRHQEREDPRLEQMNLSRWWASIRWPDMIGAAFATPHNCF